MPRNEEYLNANTLSAFPFLPDASGLNWEVGPSFPYGSSVPYAGMIPFGLFVELGLHVPEDLVQANTPIYLLQTSKPSAESMTALFGTEDESFVVNIAFLAAGTYTYGTSLSGVRHYAAVNTAAMLSYLETMSGTETFGISLPVQASALHAEIPTLKSIRARNERIYTLGGQRTGDITLRAGHNIRLQATGAAFVLSASPGAGAGKVECGEDPENTRPPLGLTPTAGNIEVRAGEEGCYVVIPGANGLFQLQGRCVACCTCEDYVAMLEDLKLIGDRIVETKDLLDWAHAKYEEGVDHYNTVIVPELLRVTLGLNGMRGSDYPSSPSDPDRGAPNRARLVASITNRRDVTSTITSWSLSVTKPTPNTIESIAYQYRGAGGTVVNGGTLPPLLPNTRLSLTFLLSTPLWVWEGLTTKEWKATLNLTADTGYDVDTLSQEVIIE